jgi:hypothetical protein
LQKIELDALGFAKFNFDLAINQEVSIQQEFLNAYQDQISVVKDLNNINFFGLNNSEDIFKNSFLNEPWYIADGWYNHIVNKNNLKMGILKNRITSQYDGYSLLDNRIKNF